MQNILSFRELQIDYRIFFLLNMNLLSYTIYKHKKSDEKKNTLVQHNFKTDYIMNFLGSPNLVNLVAFFLSDQKSNN